MKKKLEIFLILKLLTIHELRNKPKHQKEHSFNALFLIFYAGTLYY
ncbi:hypothetical protein [Neobacillus sp.]|nr:hypothetical protein [Neobacillus sp.]